MEIETPTPIQCLAIQDVLDGQDVIAKAETGTGKTLAFGAPLMARLDASRRTTLALVICPTRELAQQVQTVLEKIGEYCGIGVSLVVGGDEMHGQIKQLREMPQVIVGTPGRILDLLRQKLLSLPWLEVLVLDEADKMFEIGFLDDIREIMRRTPSERQTLLFSATYVDELLELARSETRNPVEIATARGAATVDSIEQLWMEVEEDDKADVLELLFDESDPEDVFLVFCERRDDVDALLRRLKRSRHLITALHGGYSQDVRFRVMSMFREGEIKALLATGVASRGLDVQHVTHVINTGIPRELEEYTHRIGRTGRAGREGIAITLVAPEQFRRWRPLVREMNWPIYEVDAPEPRRRSRSHSRSRRDSRDRDDSHSRGRRDSGRRDSSRGRSSSGERGSRGRGSKGRGNDSSRGGRDSSGRGRSRRGSRGRDDR